MCKHYFLVSICQFGLFFTFFNPVKFKIQSESIFVHFIQIHLNEYIFKGECVVKIIYVAFQTNYFILVSDMKEICWDKLIKEPVSHRSNPFCMVGKINISYEIRVL